MDIRERKKKESEVNLICIYTLNLAKASYFQLLALGSSERKFFRYGL